MDYSFSQLFLIAAGYLFLLFLVAWVTDRGLLPARLVRHPAVYVFSLMVYASSWAIYGSVGYAHGFGFNFLAYFLGISGVFLLAPILLAPILRLTSTYQLASLADLFAFRYRSRLAGALTTLMMLVGMLPLLSLQIKAVAESIQVLSGEPDAGGLALWYCLLVTLFAILFGARHSTTRGKHEGLVVAIAAESLIKVTAFVAITLIGLFSVFGGPVGLNEWLNTNPEALERLYQPLQDGTWHSLILAFFVSAVVMPHMFHMAFTENLNPRALMTASWGMPLLLLIMAFCVPIILWSAIAGEVDQAPDYFTLGVGALGGETGAMLAYLAGLTGASGMLIVATLALSSMTLNHLVLPIRRPRQDEGLYRFLLWVRRLLIAAILAMGYLLYTATSEQHSLTELGVLSFVATLQFVPGLIGALFWPGANRKGFFAGLFVGFSIWSLGLLVPMLGQREQALFFLELLGLQAHAPTTQWHYVAIGSMALNGVAFSLVSLFTSTSQEEINTAETCAVDSLRRPFRWELDARSVPDFQQSLTAPLGPVTAEREVQQAQRDLGLASTETRPYALRRLRDQVETNLSGLLGPSVAHQIVEDHLPYRPQEGGSSEDIQFIESRLEQYRNRLSGLAAELDTLRRFHRQTLLELPMGVVSLGTDGEIIGWNLAMERLTGISSRRTIGSRFDTLPEPWSSVLGDFAAADVDRIPQRETRLEGQTHWFSLHKSRVQGLVPGERSGGLVMLIEDVTDLRLLEARLAHSERLASIGRLAAGVAHEIGNPVTAIACLAQNMDRHSDRDEMEESAGQIIEQTRRINRIVESLVTFSHSGGTSPIQGPVSIHDTVEEAIKLLRLDPDRKRQRFDNLTRPEHLAQGDPQRLLQVFINLLGNASDACDNEAPVTVGSDADEQSLEIRVEDRGHGIPPELMHSLFEPFATSKAPGRGTGLGLALVYSIIEDHFGSIRVESPLNDHGGTRFVITLPRYRGSN